MNNAIGAVGKVLEGDVSKTFEHYFVLNDPSRAAEVQALRDLHVESAQCLAAAMESLIVAATRSWILGKARGLSVPKSPTHTSMLTIRRIVLDVCPLSPSETIVLRHDGGTSSVPPVELCNVNGRSAGGIATAAAEAVSYSVLVDAALPETALAIIWVPGR